MKQLDLLWYYQKLDMQMDEYESEKKNSPLRQKLIKLMGYLKEQQEQLVSLNDEADKKAMYITKFAMSLKILKEALKMKKNG